MTNDPWLRERFHQLNKRKAERTKRLKRRNDSRDKLMYQEESIKIEENVEENVDRAEKLDDSEEPRRLTS